MGADGNPCPVCGTASSAGAGSCARCGAVLPSATRAVPVSRRLHAAAARAAAPHGGGEAVIEPQHGSSGGRGSGSGSGDHHGLAIDPLETLPIEDPAPGAVGEDAAAIGRGFELGEELGRGGTSSVHSARQRSLARLVAVKTLGRNESGNAEFRRFRAEALATAHLEHPNIVPVHDLASAPDGTLMLAMKRVEGSTWQALLHPRSDSEHQRARTTKLDDHLTYLARVCDGIAYAHSRGIIHADLKPANVMIGEFGEVLITDWGCAVAYGPGAPTQIPRPCELATLRGSPAYLAPEIAGGRIHTISPRTDIFQLGAILYEVLTGSPPFSGANLGEVLAQATSCRIKPPTTPFSGQRPPDELCELTMQAMSLEPTARPRSVRAFAARLADYRRHAAATELAEAARAQLNTARHAPDEGEEHYHRAIAYCERALEMWPEHALGRDQLTEARIAYANFALSTRAFHLARSQASSASVQARASSRFDLQRRAEALAESAQVSRGPGAPAPAPLHAPAQHPHRHHPDRLRRRDHGRDPAARPGARARRGRAHRPRPAGPGRAHARQERLAGHRPARDRADPAGARRGGGPRRPLGRRRRHRHRSARRRSAPAAREPGDRRVARHAGLVLGRAGRRSNAAWRARPTMRWRHAPAS